MRSHCGRERNCSTTARPKTSQTCRMPTNICPANTARVGVPKRHQKRNLITGLLSENGRQSRDLRHGTLIRLSPPMHSPNPLANERSARTRNRTWLPNRRPVSLKFLLDRGHEDGTATLPTSDCSTPYLPISHPNEQCCNIRINQDYGSLRICVPAWSGEILVFHDS